MMIRQAVLWRLVTNTAGYRVHLQEQFVDEAVFGAGEGEHTLPFSIADRRSLPTESPLEILPYDVVEGAEAQVLGRLHTFAEAAFGLIAHLCDRHPVDAWLNTLTALIELFLATPLDTAGGLCFRASVPWWSQP
jgi:exonuclease V gamma subunit